MTIRKDMKEILSIQNPVTIDELTKNEFILTKLDLPFMEMERKETTYKFRYLNDSFKNFKEYTKQGWYMVGYNYK